MLRGKPFHVQSFADLEEFFRAIFDFMEVLGKGGEVWKTHHLATIRKIRNRLSNISTRSKGLVTDDGAAHDLPWGAFADRSVHVVDVAGLDPLAQDLVFARIVSKLREHLERRDLGVDHVVVFVDELNKYAPAEGADTYVRKMLLDLSERGRYLGLVLFSAQQFRSQVQRRVVGNAGTALFGRMDMDELSTPAYAMLSPATKIKLATLPKGELMVRHPHFTQPIFVRFPRPPVLGSREGIERFPPAVELPFADAVVRQLRGLDRRVTADAVRALIDGRREDEVRRALGVTRRERPDDVLAFFTACLGRRVNGEVVASRRAVPAVRRADDGYGF
jgi:DNA helicase HerA-like ATPase